MGRRVVNVSRCNHLPHFPDDEPIPYLDEVDPYGDMGVATYDEDGLVSVKWNKPRDVFLPYLKMPVAGDMGTTVPLTDWERDD